MASAGGDIIGVDWRLPLDQAWRRIGSDVGIQGNLDPAVMLGPFKEVRTAAIDILRLANGKPGHIFNLGHGVLPGTKPKDLAGLVELVHEEGVAEIQIHKGVE